MSCPYLKKEDSYDDFPTCSLRSIDSTYWSDERIECSSEYVWEYRHCPLQAWANRVGYSESNKCTELSFEGSRTITGTSIKCYCSVHKKHVDPCREGCFGSFFKKCVSYKKFESGGCFISSACTISRGLPDDCDELQILRKYRDLLVSESTEFEEIVLEYYQCAPRIVECIEHEPNKAEIYENLYLELVLKCVTMLKEGEINNAIENYLSIYRELKEKYLT